MKYIIINKKNIVLYNFFLWIKLMAYCFYYSFFYIIFRCIKIDNKKIVINNYFGKGYGDMGKYICNELIKSNNYKIYWATTDRYKSSIPDGVRYLHFDSISYLYHLFTSKVWINNCRFRFGIIKRRGQFYIQTWHGCIAYKKIEKSAYISLTKPYIMGAKNDSKMIDLMISNSKYCTNLYKEDFWYDGDILECGCPRNDIIVNNDKESIDKVKNYYGLLKTDKICLYAPTFRANSSLDAYNIDYNLLISTLNEKYKGDWKLLIRLHPNISDLANNLSGYSKNIINATDYPDMQELLVAADFLITDYSSCIFDYALSGKPAMIYACDIEDYIKDRDFAIKLEDTPFPIAKNNKELKKVIVSFNSNDYKKSVKSFYNDLGVNEPGNSCKTIARIIADITKNERK